MELYLLNEIVIHHRLFSLSRSCIVDQLSTGFGLYTTHIEKRIMRLEKGKRERELLWWGLAKSLNVLPLIGNNWEEVAADTIVRFPTPVKSWQEDHLYSKQLQNCDAFIFLYYRDFTGAGDRSIEGRDEEVTNKILAPSRKYVGQLASRLYLQAFPDLKNSPRISRHPPKMGNFDPQGVSPFSFSFPTVVSKTWRQIYLTLFLTLFNPSDQKTFPRLVLVGKKRWNLKTRHTEVSMAGLHAAPASESDSERSYRSSLLYT